jgi:threonine dehydrogenase-like Zn-dependent dehydrogenase
MGHEMFGEIVDLGDAVSGKLRPIQAVDPGSAFINQCGANSI